MDEPVVLLVADGQLIRFVALLDRRQDLRSAVSEALAPADIINLAEAEGCALTLEQLRLESRQLSAPYWPWAGKGHAWRRGFFETSLP